MTVKDYRVRVTLPFISGLPTDVAVNDFSLHGDDSDLPTNLLQLVDFYNATGTGGSGPLATYLSPELSRAANAAKIEAFDRAAAPGTAAEAVQTFTLGAANPGDTSLPTEVAVVLSFHGDLSTGIPARKRGRIYFGPLTNHSRNTASGALGIRPAQGLIDALIGAATEFCDVVSTTGTSWQVWSTVNGSGEAIEGGWVDDAFDTMRSRGNDPVVRTLYTC